mmetsp:Transcript_9462/g.19384  ORF Transcript_9462/g.19384 Transcript_9462/m.19384 type:complete len:243 (-) Transcript_9462:2072-2800(-)
MEPWSSCVGFVFWSVSHRGLWDFGGVVVDALGGGSHGEEYRVMEGVGRVRQSLTTTRERVEIHREGLHRGGFVGKVFLPTMNLFAWSLVGTEEGELQRFRQERLLECSYIVHVRPASAEISKRALRRTLAKRKIKEAARKWFPCHARRGVEYLIKPRTEAFYSSVHNLEVDVVKGLKSLQCWREVLTSNETDRPFFTESRGRVWRKWQRVREERIKAMNRRMDQVRGEVDGVEPLQPGSLTG